ncbi:hypothetical protein V6N13_024923 [Hibiscus sabdariffa]|uniref:Uncharacterized protein n=1 Tax=Hibiscus sabdariffa TaxID=183260 RepID=A0ABR2QGQ0_9ROSI
MDVESFNTILITKNVVLEGWPKSNMPKVVQRVKTLLWTHSPMHCWTLQHMLSWLRMMLNLMLLKPAIASVAAPMLAIGLSIIFEGKAKTSSIVVLIHIISITIIPTKGSGTVAMAISALEQEMGKTTPYTSSTMLSDFDDQLSKQTPSATPTNQGQMDLTHRDNKRRSPLVESIKTKRFHPSPPTKNNKARMRSRKNSSVKVDVQPR